MPRPIKISDEQILTATRAVFLEKGPRATTAEIAARAGVSEGILFKRFGNKGALLRAATSAGMVGAWIQDEVRAQGPLRTRADLVRFLHWQADVLRSVVPMVVMAWSSRCATDALPSELTGSKPAPLVAIRALAAKFQEAMEGGHLPSRNPEALARIVIGSLWYWVFLGHVLPRQRAAFDEDTLVEELADVAFAGAKTRAG